MKKLLFSAAIIVAGLATSTQAKADTLPLAIENNYTTVTTTSKMSLEDEAVYRCVYWYSYWLNGKLYHRYRCYVA
ncbi:hypothetical protein O2K51_11540 [Apibacter raozihei]|uniref:hypothetical protein n=1 Tax=Apibacter TaxID=1778601 RepID=UPI000FE32D38|nr:MULTISPECIES: hypothetical protein [Apibacter]